MNQTKPDSQHRVGATPRLTWKEKKQKKQMQVLAVRRKQYEEILPSSLKEPFLKRCERKAGHVLRQARQRQSIDALLLPGEALDE